MSDVCVLKLDDRLHINGHEVDIDGVLSFRITQEDIDVMTFEFATPIMRAAGDRTAYLEQESPHGMIRQSQWNVQAFETSIGIDGTTKNIRMSAIKVSETVVNKYDQLSIPVSVPVHPSVVEENVEEEDRWVKPPKVYL